MQETITGRAADDAPAIPLHPEPPHEPPAPAAGQGLPSLAGQAGQKLLDALDTRKHAAADAIDELAQTVQRSGEQFAGKQDWVASAIGRGAAELTTLAGVLRDRDVGELVREVQTFARRQPVLFIGAMLTSGFATARLLKVAFADASRDDLPALPEVRRG